MLKDSGLLQVLARSVQAHCWALDTSQQSIEERHLWDSFPLMEEPLESPVLMHLGSTAWVLQCQLVPRDRPQHGRTGHCQGASHQVDTNPEEKSRVTLQRGFSPLT